jgi:hypothetical protein
VAAPVAKYVDYLNIDGTLVDNAVDAGTNWYYKRVWSIEVPAGKANIKLITVTATVRVASQGGIGQLPRSTVSALKTNPF